MKKCFLALLTTGAFLAFGCNANNNETAMPPVQNDATTNVSSAPEVGIKDSTAPLIAAPVQSREAPATAELCSCVNSFLAGMSPRVRQIIVDAGKSNNPVQVLTIELQKVKGEEEQQRLMQELATFENNQDLQQCSDNVQKKYNFDENSNESRDRLLQAARQNKECEVVYALMKISLEQEKRFGAPQ